MLDKIFNVILISNSFVVVKCNLWVIIIKSNVNSSVFNIVVVIKVMGEFKFGKNSSRIIIVMFVLFDIFIMFGLVSILFSNICKVVFVMVREVLMIVVVSNFGKCSFYINCCLRED